ncbi:MULTISPECIES: hypothetical protein [unclassified Blastomonas]|uniref:hypothetical protein n=1 Tax=unclassified Blastomonas TaxID=2626550 RepID=UPI0008254D1A|nr:MULTISPECIES: hypothetical protein [unclassified Blastomonas]
MALKANNTCVALKLQESVDTFSSPSSTTDVLPVSQLAFSIAGVTIANDEYTGSEAKNGAEVSGKNATLSYRVKIRPPGGSAVPNAGEFLLGRILVAAKMTENRIGTAVPASAEALGSGSTTTAAVLGSGAAGTANLYKGLALTLAGLGSNTRSRLTAIRSYAANKTAVIMETAGSTISGNYQIPTQLSYQRSVVAGDAPFASQRIWLDGHRYDLVNCVLTSLRIVIPASTREAAAFPELEVSWAVTIFDDDDEATPVVPSLGPTPKWRDGKFFMGGRATPGSNLTLDSGLSVGYPPNPNKEEGNDAPQLIEATASLTFERHHSLKAVVDHLAQADAQAQHSVFAQWGYTAGGIVQLVVPDARFNYASPNLGGGFITESGDMFIDALDKGFCLNFPYPA